MFENLGKKCKENNIINFISGKYHKYFSNTRIYLTFTVFNRGKKKTTVKPKKTLSFRKMFLKADIKPPKFLLKFKNAYVNLRL